MLRNSPSLSQSSPLRSQARKTAWSSSLRALESLSSEVEGPVECDGAGFARMGPPDSSQASTLCLRRSIAEASNRFSTGLESACGRGGGAGRSPEPGGTYFPPALPLRSSVGPVEAPTGARVSRSRVGPSRTSREGWGSDAASRAGSGGCTSRDSRRGTSGAGRSCDVTVSGGTTGRPTALGWNA